MQGRHIKLPASCWNVHGDVFAKHRYLGDSTFCCRCGSLMSEAGRVKRAQRILRRRRQKERVA